MIAAKELTTKLSFLEEMAISYTVKLGFNSGSIGNVEWELESLIAEDYGTIGDAISIGKYSGECWKFTFKKYATLDI